MPQTQATVSEIVTFRLNEGTDAAAFAKAARALEPMLRASGDAITRTLSCDADGLWTDHITWTTMEAAKTAAEQIMSDPAAAPMMQMIAPDSVVMRHARVQYLME